MLLKLTYLHATLVTEDVNHKSYALTIAIFFMLLISTRWNSFYSPSMSEADDYMHFYLACNVYLISLLEAGDRRLCLITLIFIMTSTGSVDKPNRMVVSPDQHLIMTTRDNFITKIKLLDGSHVYKHKGLLFTNQLTTTV